MPFSLKRPAGPPLLARTYRQYEIGPHSYGWVTIQDFGDSTRLRIGDYCSFADGTLILVGGEHRLDWVTTYPFPVLWPEAKAMQGHPGTRGDIVIGNDVWVGARATILSGVTVGHGAAIGAGSVVSSDIPPYCVAAGNPSRVVRQRFDETTIASLLKLQWWTWPEDRIIEALPLLLDPDPGKLIAFAHWRENEDS